MTPHRGSSGSGGVPYCKAHGGGRRCQHDGCAKSAQGGTYHCKAHGGGRRCQQSDCNRPVTRVAGSLYCRGCEDLPHDEEKAGEAAAAPSGMAGFAQTLLSLCKPFSPQANPGSSGRKAPTPREEPTSPTTLPQPRDPNTAARRSRSLYKNL
jgi:hypothetical protein